MCKHHRPLMEAVESRLLMAKALGIDVSHWQGSINWTSVKNAGKVFALVKATEGITYTDPTFVTNMTNGKNAGVKMGFYHFARPDNNTAAAEATHFLNVAASYMVPGNFPPVLDLETAGGLTGTQLSQWANDFNNVVFQATGIKPMIYTSTNWATNIYNQTVAQWPLWIANWPSNPNPETGNPGVGDSNSGWPASSWKIWQYSSTGAVPGISGNVDLDVFNGDLTALTAFLVTAPEIGVTQGGGNVAKNQVAPIDFGSIAQNGVGPSRTFTVTNTGGMKLNLGAVSLPSGYTLTEPLVSSLMPNASDTFTIQLNTSTIGTKSGNVIFTTNDPDEAPFVFPVTGSVIGADSTPPSVATANFDYLVPTHQLTFTFSENVSASLSLGDFHIENTTGGFQIFPSSYSYDLATNVATVGFSGVLPDANYRATVYHAGIQDAATNVMAADYVYDFFFLKGDANHDRKVDIADLSILATNWQGSGKTFADGDFNYNTTVDIADLSALASNWQQSLAAPAQPVLAPRAFAQRTASARLVHDVVR